MKNKIILIISPRTCKVGTDTKKSQDAINYIDAAMSDLENAVDEIESALE